EGVAPTVHAIAERAPGARVLIAVERFVVGSRAARSRAPGGGAAAQAVIAELVALVRELARERDAALAARSAATVKLWAADKRLAAAGWLRATEGMPHARDAARHALFAAVAAGVVPDPLSARACAR
ncbi:MAG: hypothetical protein FWD74_09115, partial [Actinomycetia bacterium]|nr:hypothetical protein [Actinomycetes bacterium]